MDVLPILLIATLGFIAFVLMAIAHVLGQIRDELYHLRNK
ncbi:MAG: hypothetical protein UT87_C0002G0025 [Candidatus Levybacteria bacterium GW2011_GWC1_40_19]|nr:MAG: hypothetical protein UT46_C0002G0028 [Candidatus Levybacteria bacterium GW2011_GWA1_39_34]KKR51644.1 MAG: hypothetical protein UT87_C0002G0025 [Candidatus Levybacteria bacterium GW2011_GWC1_40_19]KKR72396.1 MAG: hypothetical protein UU15_C0029G0003 [Candidatus Levybacteria bacterium GW2011_GWC2_40_7]KKR95494.1 MAG: hypothetical protein UU45_C0001G0089 [Candidatus Levybacteria bacterium GW2011_GWA2_41_15]KKS02441.1 MAG: hypothetical protein UU52_C0001G0025 [Candidatus Levybacteria bacter